MAEIQNNCAPFILNFFFELMYSATRQEAYVRSSNTVV